MAKFTVCVFDEALKEDAVHHVEADDPEQAAAPWEELECDYIAVFAGHLSDLYLPNN